MKRTFIYLTEREVEWIKERADKKGITFSDEVRRSLDKLIDQEEKESKE